jgi:hypothetical protein
VIIIFKRDWKPKQITIWIVWSIKNYMTSISKKFDKVIDSCFPMTLAGEWVSKKEFLKHIPCHVMEYS